MAKNHGCEKLMLELLRPRDFKHPFKVFLDKWYSK